jgi:O-succinylbenzoate synthase
VKRLYTYRIPLKNGAFREGVIVQIGAGYGDIAPLPGYSAETLEEAKEEAQRLLPSFPKTIPKLPSVQFAFRCARSPILNPVSVPVGALHAPKKGFHAVKLKLGSVGVEQATALIASTPQEVELRLDFNQQWPLEWLLALSRRFPPQRFAYFEEPTRNFSDLIAFSRMTGIGVALDESIPQVPYWDVPTLKALIVKPTVLGRVPTPPPGVELIFSSAYESGIGALHIAHLASLHNPGRPHGLDPYSWLMEDVLQSPPLLADGTFSWQGPSIALNSSAHLFFECR